MPCTSQAHRSILIRGGRIIDPATGRDEVADVAIADGRYVERARDDAFVIQADGWIVCPGLIDIHVHLREPGSEHKETIETGTAAAAAGGFTYVACMPNTIPPLDSPDAIRFVLDKARAVGHCDVGPIAAITRGRSGKAITDFAALLAAGAVGFSDDGTGVERDDVMRSALEAAREHHAVVIQHCEYREMSAGGVMHLGKVSRSLGLPGLDPRSEEAMIERDIALCQETRGRYHVSHVSTARGIELVRAAKAQGVPVSAEVCTHHLVLTDEACRHGDPNTKMHPPLRSSEDVAACRAGLLDGTIDCIVTDHAPHAEAEKAVGFLKAPPGVVGLETAIGVAARAMIDSGLADWPRLIEWFTTAPAAVLGLAVPQIRIGAAANLAILDPAANWTVDPKELAGKSRNTPFSGWRLPARAIGTVRGERLFAFTHDES